jgi:hypothetical protein
MRRLTVILVLLVSGTLVAFGQFRTSTESRPTVSESLVRPDDGGLLFGWFDPSRFSMHQSFSLSYMTGGGQGLSLGVYTNSMFYQISKPLDVQFDVSVMHSPYSSLGNAKDFSGIFLSRAQLDYRPAENMLLQISYRQLPSMYWWGAGQTGSAFMNTPYGFDEEQH